jgi:hypothetical protein
VGARAIAAALDRRLDDAHDGRPSDAPAGLLNRLTPGVFRDDEAVEILLGEMVTEDLLHLWELLGSGHYQLSVPYVARNIRIESQREFAAGAPVQERITDYGKLVGS